MFQLQEVGKYTGGVISTPSDLAKGPSSCWPEFIYVIFVVRLN